MDVLPDKLSFRCLKDFNLADISFDVCELNMLVMKYMNHIAPNNLYIIIDLFFGTDKFYDNLSKNISVKLDVKDYVWKHEILKNHLGIALNEDIS